MESITLYKLSTIKNELIRPDLNAPYHSNQLGEAWGEARGDIRQLKKEGGIHVSKNVVQDWLRI